VPCAIYALINLPHCAAGLQNRNIYINIYLITPLNFVNRKKEKTYPIGRYCICTSEFRRHKVELDEKKKTISPISNVSIHKIMNN